jgi:hypothetical protein
MFNLVVARVQTLTTGSLQPNNCSHNSRFNSINAQGTPLQQQWSYQDSGGFAPSYYLQSDAPLYDHSFTDAHIAMAYKALSEEEQARLNPMITGFNPADMYAADHIRRVLQTFPGLFSGTGEFTSTRSLYPQKSRERPPALRIRRWIDFWILQWSLFWSFRSIAMSTCRFRRKASSPSISPRFVPGKQPTRKQTVHSKGSSLELGSSSPAWARLAHRMTTDRGPTWYV